MTAAPASDLSDRTARGAAVMLLARGLGTALSIGATAVIARFVTPEEFGVVAMVIAILGIARVLEEFGLGDAAIQAERITDGEVTSLAIVNLVAGVGLAAGFMACAPLVAGFYDRPELVSICLALAPLFVFAGLGSQPRAMMRRRFRFRSLAIAQTVSLACAAVTGMVAAIAGLGVWAIVLQHLAGAAALAVGCWIASGWRPRRPAPLASIRPLLGYGLNLGLSQFLNALTRNVDDILIGRWVGPAALGAYGRAFQLMTLPSTQLNQPLTSAVVPALSRLQNDPAGYRRLYRTSVEVIASLAFPLAVFTGVAAPAMVGTLLGPDWSESVPLLRALTPAGLMVSLNVATGW
ncbi:MAG: oligosaccharide flippase family protein, partial [Planctomycetia bacterium]|nr:oligosaccharide flippase family protein [Planctomycetia bacterium]